MSLLSAFEDSRDVREVECVDYRPALNSLRVVDDLVLDIDLPGVDPESVEVTVSDGLLEVSGERPGPRPADAGVIGAPSGRFLQRVDLPVEQVSTEMV